MPITCYPFPQLCHSHQNFMILIFIRRLFLRFKTPQLHGTTCPTVCCGFPQGLALEPVFFSVDVVKHDFSFYIHYLEVIKKN